MSVRELVIGPEMGLPYPTGSKYEGAIEKSILPDGRVVELPEGFGE
jgi:hypothetical protein